MRDESKSQLGAFGGGARWMEPARRAREVTVHLALHELAARHRFTALGWAWPLVRQLIQVGVLLFVFTAVFDLGIDDYGVFLFAGLVAWSWFFSSVGDGTGALPAHRHLLLQPRCPAAALPLVPVAAASVDALIALPVLLGAVAVSGTLDAALILLPVLAAIQLLLMVGIVWFTAAANVYLRDVGQLVTIGLMLLFYLTPVFYELGKVPDDLQWVLHLNPLTTLIEAYRDVLLEEHLPSALPLVAVGAASAAIAAAGLVFFNRLRPGFVDEL